MGVYACYHVSINSATHPIPSLTPHPLIPIKPATISRCGMIYLESASLGWEPIFDSWLAALPPILKNDGMRLYVDELFRWVFKGCLNFLRLTIKVSLFVNMCESF